jgi:hypothetical protein
MLILLILLASKPEVKSQISDIKDLASGAADIFSGCAASDVSAGCNAFNCCWDGGFYFFDFLIDHHHEIMNLRYLDPCLLSLEVDANIAYAIHYSTDSNQYYNYVNYLPHVRGNLGIFSTDFRYNMLTEYTNDLPDSYKSWELLFMLNFVPVDGFKMSLGSGVFYEMFTEKYYNEHYFDMQFGLFENKDFIDLDTRVVVDYNTSVIPFLEAGMKYSMKFINFNRVYAYLSLGGFYQNYYESHDIWAASAGIMLNIH